MSFVASTDKWPIILDSAGNPLSWGKLYYTQVDTYPCPKPYIVIFCALPRFLELL